MQKKKRPTQGPIERPRGDDVLAMPEMIALCTTCTQDTCHGICADAKRLSAELVRKNKPVIVRTDADGNVTVFRTITEAAAAIGVRAGTLSWHISGHANIKACAVYRWQKMRAEDAQIITGGIR